MNCIIIDDEETSRNILLKLCSKAKNLNVVKDFSNATDALEFLKNNTVDLIFLDLHMPVVSGFQFLDLLTIKPKIILTTIDKELAIKAFEYRCIVDYLGKPFSYPRLLQALDKVDRSLKLSDPNNFKKSKTNSSSNSSSNYLYVNMDKKFVRVNIENIEIIRTVGKKIKISTSDNNYIIRSSLKKIQEKLPEYMFKRVHQSFVVNVAKIVDVNKNSIHINNEIIPVSRLNKCDLLDRINPF